MAGKITRWVDGAFALNPFNITYEQLKTLLTKENEVKDEYGFTVKYNTYYKWGRVHQEISIDKHILPYHEIMIWYNCPSSYSRQKKIDWLKKHGYPFEVI